MHSLRLGAVHYLNVQPLVFGLDREEGVALRFDAPSDCSRLLAAGTIDLGTVPSIAYLDDPGYRIVPGVCIGSEGPVASVSLFARKRIDRITSIAVDTSSRTSAVLLRILCARRFGISPAFVPHPPDPVSMLAVADAALVIGDAALFADHRTLAAEKVDLGAAWTDLTGLPFVWAFWAGRPGAADSRAVTLLQQAATTGTTMSDVIARQYCAGNAAGSELAARYLRENLLFDMTPRAVDGLLTFYDEAARLGLVESTHPLTFFDEA